MAPDGGGSDGQPKTMTTTAPVPRLLHSVKRLEYAIKLLLWYTRPPVGNTDTNVILTV